MRVEQLAGMREAFASGLVLLGMPSRDDLLRILVEPGRRAGYEFEDPELPREMVEAVAEQPGALPLLSFTAARVWELRDRHFHQLPRKAYQTIGGVGGACLGEGEGHRPSNLSISSAAAPHAAVSGAISSTWPVRSIIRTVTSSPAARAGAA